MKKPLILFRAVCLLCILAIGYPLRAATYYFSASAGDDSRSANAAQNPSTPWRSLSRLNAIFSSLRPGDSVLFRRGDVFEGAITATASGSAAAPIVFSAYGSGANPVISGFATFKNWAGAGANIWEATSDRAGSELNVLLVNGNFQPIGRYPNANAAQGGYLNVDAYQGNTSIFSAALAGGKNWNGGEVVIRKNQWILDRNQITGHNGNTLQYKTGSGYHATAGYGFFIQNHPGTLDQNGEWYFSNKKLGIYLNVAPTAYTIQGSVVPTLVTISAQSNLLFTGLDFIGANNDAFRINNAGNIAIVNCAVKYTGGTAFAVSGTNGLRVEKTMVDYTNDVAFNLSASGTVLRNNTIKRSGSVAGMGRSGDGTYTAVLINGNNNLVEGNTIEQTGYVPISFNGSDVTIKNNFINEFSLVKDDGGGIYTWNNSGGAPTYTNRKVIANIVVNGRSASNGSKEKEKKFAHGIYIDDNATNVEVSGNTVANCEGYGLYIHNARANKILQNTFYNNTVQIAMVRDDIAPNSPINNTEVKENIFFSLHPDQLVAEYKSNADDIQGFGIFDKNHYLRPFDDHATIGILKKVGGNYTYQIQDLSGWQAMRGKDASSKASPRTLAHYTVQSVVGGNKFSNGTFANNIGGLYAFSPANNCNTAWSSNGLDGGSLAVSFSGKTATSKGTIIIGVGAITAGKKYMLRFSVRGGNEHKMLDIYLRKSGSPYTDVTERRLSKVTAARREVALLFTATESTSDGSIGIDVPEHSATLYFDNIELKEVAAVFNKPADSVRFVYNATANSVATNIGGKYIDAKAAAYNNTITLAPFASAVLITAGSGSVVAPPTPPPPVTTCSATGSIFREQWFNVSGNDVGNIPLQQAPAASGQLYALEEAPDQFNNYGSRLRGYICPPQTGNYTFWVAGDDAAELWLSNSEDPGAKTRIAYNLSWTNFREWNKYATQKSATINLVAGKKYYVEVLHKEGGGGDHLSVAWQLPDGTMEAPIGGSRLSPYQPVAMQSQTISFAALPTFTLGSAPLTLSATASSGLPVSFSIVSGNATLSGNKLTPAAAGTVVIKASQAGNNKYIAAPDVQQSLTVVAAPGGGSGGGGNSSCSDTGSILREQWNGIAGNTIADIPLTTAPTSSMLTQFEGGQNIGDRYASRIRGYICPPETGNYTFWIAGDDATELWLSTSDQPSGKKKIAYSVQYTNYREWKRFTTQQSAPVRLEAGRKYYIEALQKEGNGGDHLSVAWQLPGGTMEAPIAGKRLIPFATSATAAQSAIAKTATANLPSLSHEVTNAFVQVTVFPNPFAAQASVELTIPTTATATVNVQDETGRVVSKLYSGLLQGGVKYRFSLNGSNLSSGVYYLRVVAGDKSHHHKIMVAK